MFLPSLTDSRDRFDLIWDLHDHPHPVKYVKVSSAAIWLSSLDTRTRNVGLETAIEQDHAGFAPVAEDGEKDRDRKRESERGL